MVFFLLTGVIKQLIYFSIKIKNLNDSYYETTLLFILIPDYFQYVNYCIDNCSDWLKFNVIVQESKPILECNVIIYVLTVMNP